MEATKYQDYMFGLIKKVIDQIGARPACSEAENKLGKLLVEEWKPICDRVDAEPFTCSPGAFHGSIKLAGLLYLTTVILYWFFPPMALATAALVCSIIVLQVFRVREFVDFLFPRKQGENVIGVIRPEGQVAKRVIVGGHLDSGPEFNLFLHLKSASFPLIALGVLAAVIALLASLAKTIAYFNVFSNEAALTGLGIALVASSPLIVPFLFFSSWKPVPGAWDNMSAVSVAAGLGKYLSEAKRTGQWFPERTEVVLMATSSEEVGARGAKRYVESHLKDLKHIPTHFLALEMIKDEKFLWVSKGEPSIGARHDPQLTKLAQEAAEKRNWPIVAKLTPQPFYTDAARFSLCGISATCLYSADPNRFDPTHHTRYDTCEHVRPESLSVMLQLVIDMIKRIDESK